MATEDAGEFILLVEDNPDDADLLMREFRTNQASIRIQLVQDGQEALDFLFGNGPFRGRNLREQPAVVLLDLNLPKVDGLRVLMRIRADGRTRNVPVVVVTGSQVEEKLLVEIRSQVIASLQKPVTFGQLSPIFEVIGLCLLASAPPPPPPPSQSRQAT